MTGAPAAVGKQATQSPLDETTAWDDQQKRDSAGPFASAALVRRPRARPPDWRELEHRPCRYEARATLVVDLL
jgi:hypothetical protein